MTIWFDVEDLIRYFQGAARPTGIQRFSFETCYAAAQLAGDEVGFCRRDENGTSWKQVDFAGLAAGIKATAAQPLAAAPSAVPPPPPPPAPYQPSALIRLGLRLPPHYRRPLGQLRRAGRMSLCAVRDLAQAAAASLRTRRRPAPYVGGHNFDPAAPDISFGPGDWLVNLGASWERPYSSLFLDGLAEAGAGFALFAHDMIPELFPEWCTESMVRDFSIWLDEAVPRANRVFTISDHTAQDLRHCLAQRGRRVPDCTKLPPGGAPGPAGPPLPRPLAQPYVLMVGTIEARKNHGGMLRVWRRMLADMPAEDVPALVFAGRVGWLTTDLMQQLENARFLDGKIIFIDRPPEDQLAALYQHCLFTVFPSLYEGWGLPVTESLNFGQPVAASNRAAIPEAGGAFCCYFDPDNLTEAYERIRAWIERPSLVEAARRRIASAYEPPRWENTAASLLAKLRGGEPWAGSSPYPATSDGIRVG